MNEFLEKMSELLEVETQDINMHGEFRDFSEWDSLAQISLLAIAQDDYNKVLTADDLKGATTFKDLFNLVSA